MTTRIHKLATATAVMAGLATTVPVAQAAVLGGAAEALLVPLTVWSNGDFQRESFTPPVDTVIEVVVPSTVGFDDIPNIYTAANSTPTNLPGPTRTDADKDIDAIHWFWFDKTSVERASGTIPVTPDDVVQISWTEAANGQFENEPGYFVIVTEGARSGAAAEWSMFGNAWLTSPLNGLPGLPAVGASIPVLGMNDGADGPRTDPFGNSINCAQPTAQDSVKYRAGVPCAVSPVIGGFRTNRSDGDGEDLFVFDVALSNRFFNSVQVIWVDHNLDGTPGQGGTTIASMYPENQAFPNPVVSVDVFDLDENACNTSVELPYELNVIHVPPALVTDESQLQGYLAPLDWATQVNLLCVVSDTNPFALFNAGFVRYKLSEYIDQGVDRAESAMFAFSLKADLLNVSNDAVPVPNTLVFWSEASLGHDHGTYKD